MLTELTTARPFSVGDKVTVTADYRNIEDAEDGPLKPGMCGVVVKDDESSKPFEVQCGERSWWYVAKALQKADETIVSSKPANETKSNATIVSGEPAGDQVSLSLLRHFRRRRCQDQGISGLGKCRVWTH
jgi:hypothetical protein